MTELEVESRLFYDNKEKGNHRFVTCRVMSFLFGHPRCCSIIIPATIPITNCSFSDPLSFALYALYPFSHRGFCTEPALPNTGWGSYSFETGSAASALHCRSLSCAWRAGDALQESSCATCGQLNTGQVWPWMGVSHTVPQAPLQHVWLSMALWKCWAFSVRALKLTFCSDFSKRISVSLSRCA